MREGVIYPKFAEKFFRIDFESVPMPVLCLYPIPSFVELKDLRMNLCGLEKHPRSIPWENFKDLPRVKLEVPLICQIFNWSEKVEWEGIRLVDLLDFLKIETHPEGYYSIFSRDGVYFETLSRDEARDPRVLLAYGLNGAPLPEAHGGPLRLVVPFLQGYKSVKWVGGIQAFRHDPMGIKRLLGQSPSSHLNENWLDKFGIVLPEGKKGDPPPLGLPIDKNHEGSRSQDSSKIKPLLDPVQATYEKGSGIPSSKDFKKPQVLCEILAIIRPQKHESTRKMLREKGIGGYTTYSVLGRSRQRGLRFSREEGKQEVAIKFLPKQVFSIIVEESLVQSTVDALIKVNRTRKGEFGDGKIFVLGLEEAVRVSSDERGVEAV